jgi:hypothetical protein
MDKAALETSLNTLDKWLIVFGVLVAIGVVGESIAGFLHWRRSGQLQRVQFAENLKLQKDVSDANTRAVEAQLALEKYKAPRSLTLEQLNALRTQMEPFGKVPFDGATEESHEPSALLTQICATLQSAGWDWQNWGLGVGPALKNPKYDRILGIYPGVSGTEIQLQESDRVALEKPAVALINALNAAGITATPHVYTDDAAKQLERKSGVIHVIVGAK